jgi:predicted dienelactone hydrolase
MRIHALLLTFAAGCADPDTTPDSAASSEAPYVAPSELGPYAPGVIMLDITDPRGKSMRLEVWYPARVSEGAEPDPYEDVPITIGSFRQAVPEVESGPFPLVAFSHGFAGIRVQSAFLTEHLASHGFVVVAPDHNFNTFLDIDQSKTVQVLLERPDDIRYAVDHVLALSDGDDRFLGGMIELGDGYAMIGHSFGAYTSAVVAGGTLDPGYAEVYCAERGGQVCSYLDDFEPSMLEGHGTGDDRAVLSVPMSGGLWYLFGEGGAGLSSVRNPLVIGGSRDQVLGYEDELLPSYDAMSAPKRLATFVDAGHYGVFSEMCFVKPFAGLFASGEFADCAGLAEGYMDIEAGKLALKTLVTAYLKDQLVGDGRYAVDWTAEGMADHDGVIIEIEE